MEKGDASALLRIPERFTEDLVEGKPTVLSLVRNPAQGILPEIAEQMLRVFDDVLDSGSRVLRGPLDRIHPFVGQKKIHIDDETIVGITLAVKQAFDGADTFLFPPAITVDSSSWSDPQPKKESGNISTIFLLVLPGMSVYTLFLVGDLAMRDLLAEATAGTLRRLLAGPVRAGTLVVAKAISTGILSLLVLAVLTIVGAVVLRKAVDPAGLLVLSLALVLAVTGTSATIYGLAANEKRGATIGSIVYLVLAFGSGSFVPLDSLPRAVRAAAPISPFYWGTTGFRTLIESGGTLADVLPNVAVLAGLGAALLALGAFLLHRSVRSGSLA
jgi:ABC-2 type transport system permease protein